MLSTHNNKQLLQYNVSLHKTTPFLAPKICLIHDCWFASLFASVSFFITFMFYLLNTQINQTIAVSITNFHLHTVFIQINQIQQLTHQLKATNFCFQTMPKSSQSIYLIKSYVSFLYPSKILNIISCFAFVYYPKHH